MSWLAFGINETLGVSISIASLNIGTAHANRWVIAGIVSAFRDDGGNPATDFSSVTIGGVPATLLSKNLLAGSLQVAFYAANVPTGTTATVVVTANGEQWFAAVAVAVCDGEPTLHAAAYDRVVSSNTWDVNIDVPAGGNLLAIQFQNHTTTTSWTWTGATEDFNNISTSYKGGYASAAGLGVETGRLVRAVNNSNFNNAHGLGVITFTLPSGGSAFRPQSFGGRALVVNGKLFGLLVPG